MTQRSHKTTRSRAKSVPLSREEIEEIVQKTIERTFANLGIHAHTDEEVDALRADLAYTRAWRIAVQKGTRTSFLTVLTVLITGGFGLLWVGFRVAFLGHP